MGDSKTIITQAFEKYADELFRYCVFRVSDHERARELTQDTYLKAWEYMQKGEPVRECRAFLYQILRNLIIDEYRKKKSVSLEALISDDTNEIIESMIPKSDIDEMESALNRFEAARVLVSIKKLPELYQEMLLYRYINSLTISEIATITGESENVISVRVHRGLKMMRTILENEKTL